MLDKLVRGVHVLGITALVGGCQSIDWADDDPVHGLRWRDRRAFVFGSDVVLARDSASADETAEDVGALRRALVDRVGAQPGPTLWIAMGTDEVALATDPEQLLALFGSEQNVPQPAKLDPRRHGAPGRGSDGERRMREPTPAEQQRLIGWTVRSIAMPVDLTRSHLDLPSEIVGRVQSAFVYPTTSGLEAVANGMLDTGLAMQELTIWESTVFALTRGSVVDHLVAALVEQRQRGLLEWLAADLVTDGEDSAAKRVALHAALGLPPPRSAPELRSLTVTELRAQPFAVFPDSTAAFAIDWADDSIEVVLDASIDTWVRVQPNAHFDADVGKAGGTIIVMRRARLERSDLDALFDRIGDAPGRVLLHAPSREVAAAVATLHALERRGLSDTDARALWTRYGMDPVAALDFANLRHLLGQ